MSLLERVYSFHQDLLRQRYPNATTLVDRFEVSLATARRDIAYLRDRLMAPLAFDNRRNGFAARKRHAANPGALLAQSGDRLRANEGYHQASSRR